MAAEGRGADVVLDHARATEQRFEFCAKGEFRPAEVDRQADRAGQRIHPAGDADTDRGDVIGRCAGLRKRPVDDTGDDVGRLRLGPGRGGRRVACEDALIAIDDEDGDLGATDVDADEQRTVTAPRGAVRGGTRNCRCGRSSSVGRRACHVTVGASPCPHPRTFTRVLVRRL
jgi:hypothetical protein